MRGRVFLFDTGICAPFSWRILFAGIAGDKLRGRFFEWNREDVDYCCFRLKNGRCLFWRVGLGFRGVGFLRELYLMEYSNRGHLCEKTNYLDYFNKQVFNFIVINVS